VLVMLTVPDNQWATLFKASLAVTVILKVLPVVAVRAGMVR